MIGSTIAILLGVLLVGAEAETEGTPTAPGPQARADFVGSARCAECHAAQFAKWSGSQHARAMQPATEQTVLGDFDDESFSHHGLTSRFFRRDGKFFVRTEGADGAPADFEVKYTFGVEPLQQYLIEQRGGRLQALGIAWSTTEGKWFPLYADEDVPVGSVLHWTGPGQNWNSMCADCHSTNVRRNYRMEEDRYETSWSEVGVGCEACHGPGAPHVRSARSRSDGSKGPVERFPVSFTDSPAAAWDMNRSTGIAARVPARTSHTEVEACAACHSRRTPLAGAYAFGRPLLDTFRPALLEEGLYHPDGQVEDEVYVYGSFLQSKMYRAGVTCGDCHDAHAAGVHAQGNALCARCHREAKFDTPAHHFHEAGSAGAQCVACHMPVKTFMVVDPRRDHSFRVPRPDLTPKIGSPNPCTGCHAEHDAAWAAGKVEEWYGVRPRPPHYGEAIHSGRHALADAEAALVRVADDAGQAAIVRASALALLGPYLSPASIPTVERALADEEPLVRLGALDAVPAADPSLRLRLAYRLLDDPVLAVRIAAVPAVASVAAGLMSPPQRARLERAVGAYAAAQMVSSDRPGAHVGLGVVHAQLGDLQAAERDYANALRVGPYFIPAYVNLADLKRLRRRDDEGEALLRKALAIAPDSAAVYHSLGLLLVRRHRLPEALGALRRAMEIEPQDPRYAYVYAVALYSTGAPERALHVLEQAHERHPGDAQILTSLVRVSREQGAREAALRYARRLVELRPHDPGPGRLLEQIEAERKSAP